MTSSPTSITSARAVSGATDFPDLAIIGKAGSGKTTLAQAIKGPLGLGYKHLSFAYNLKQIAVKLWGQGALLDRGLMQDLGFKMREIDVDVWCDALVREVQNAKDGAFVCNEPPPRFVVDDCRFQNEYDALKAEGFVFVRCVSPEPVRVDRLRAIGKFQTHEQLYHVSETSLDHIDADYVIDTYGPTEVALLQLQDIIHKERSKR